MTSRASFPPLLYQVRLAAKGPFRACLKSPPCSSHLWSSSLVINHHLCNIRLVWLQLFSTPKIYLNSESHPYTGNQNSETPGDIETVLLHYGDVLGAAHTHTHTHTHTLRGKAFQFQAGSNIRQAQDAALTKLSLSVAYHIAQQEVPIPQFPYHPGTLPSSANLCILGTFI